MLSRHSRAGEERTERRTRTTSGMFTSVMLAVGRGRRTAGFALKFISTDASSVRQQSPTTLETDLHRHTSNQGESPEMRSTGKVKWFNDAKGTGVGANKFQSET